MHSAETLTNLQKFLTLLNPSHNLNEMLTNVARQLVEMFEVDHSGVLFFGETDPEGKVIAEYPDQGALALNVPLTHYPLIERLKVERQPLAVLDAQNDPLMGSAQSAMRTLGIKSILIMPLVVQNKLIGSLSLDAIRHPRAFTPAELDLCQVIGQQIAVAVDYTHALEAAETSHRQAQTLHEVNRVLSESLDPDDVLPLILEQLQKVITADGSSIHLLVNGGVQLVTCWGAYNAYEVIQPMPLNELWGAQEIIRHKTPVLLGNTAEYIHWQNHPGNPVKSWMGLPLSVRGEVVGILNIDGYTPNQFNESHIRLAQTFASQAAIAIHNARLYRQAEKRAELLVSVQEIGLRVAVSLDLEEVLRVVAEAVLTLLEAHQVRIYLYDSQSDTFDLTATLDGAESVEIIARRPRPDGLTATVARSGRYVAVPNVREHPLYHNIGDHQGFKAIIGAPLKKGAEVLGVLNVFYLESHAFTSDELDLLHLLATQAAVAITNARIYQAELAARVRADTLSEVAATLGESLDLNRVLEQILAQLKRVVTYDTSSIILREGDIFRIVAARGFDNLANVIGVAFTFAEKTHFQEIARTHRPLVIADTLEFAGWRQDGPSVIRSWIGVPLLVSDQLIGLLAVDHSQPNFYHPADGEDVIAFAHLAAIALENARLYEFEVKQVEQELTIARQIQQGFFPEYTPAFPGWEIAAVCLPARETGGDFYEFVERADDTLGVVVGDVSGKSIPAAMLMAAAQSLANAKGSDHYSPARVMAETNRLLYKDVPIGSFVAMSYALLLANKGEVCLSNGGQLAPLLLPARGEPIRLIETPGNHLPLGIIADVTYEELTFTLAPGDLLIFYTDGLVERMDAAGQLFGFERLMEALEPLRGQSPEMVLQALLQAADTFANGAGPADDVTLVVVQRVDE